MHLDTNTRLEDNRLLKEGTNAPTLSSPLFANTSNNAASANRKCSRPKVVKLLRWKCDIGCEFGSVVDAGIESVSGVSAQIEQSKDEGQCWSKPVPALSSHPLLKLVILLKN